MENERFGYLRRNILLIGIIRVCYWFMFYMPIVKLFYEENQLGNFELFLLHGIYSVLIAVGELPSGYMADIWGRKKTLILGSLLSFAGFFTYSISKGFWYFAIAEILLGIGMSFISGADSAILFDTLFDLKKEKSYLKYEGKITSAGNFAEATGALVMLLLIHYGIKSYRIGYILQTIVIFIALTSSFFLYEPKKHKTLVYSNLNYFINILKFSYKNKILRIFILLSGLIGFSTLSMAWFAQIFFYEINIKPEIYPVLWILLNATVGIGSYFSVQVEKKLGMSNSILFILITSSILYFLTGLFVSLWGLVFLFLFYIIRGIATPVLKYYINLKTPSEMRATILSIRSFIIRITFSLLGPLLGYLSDITKLKYSLIITSFFIFFSGLILWYNYIAANKIIPAENNIN